MDEAAQIVKDLVVTPNGRLFLIGSILSAGAAYYIFDQGSDQIDFAYVVLGLGSIMILLSMVMASWATYMHEKQRLEIMKMDQQIRERRMNAGEKDKTVYRVDR